MTAAGMTDTRPRVAHWFKHGLIGGIIAGITFAMFEMVVAAVVNGMEAFFMPLRMIGGMALGQGALDPGSSLIAAAGAGIVVHMVLSMMFGVVIAGAARYVRVLAASTGTLLVWTSVAGLGLWLVNFYLIAPIGGWNWFPEMTDPVIQFVAHTFFFGTVLGIYLNAVARRAA